MIFNLICKAIRKLLNRLDGPLPEAEVDAKLAEEALKINEPLDWHNSIVDLMKVLNLDSSLKARKELAQELGYTGKLDGSAEMNTWLAKEVRKRVATQDVDDLRA